MNQTTEETEKRNRMREYFSQLRANPPSPESLDSLKTYCLEIWSLMREGLDDLALMEGLHFETDGLKAKIKFADKKMYEISINPVKE